jgi:hypothetical protein
MSMAKRGKRESVLEEKAKVRGFFRVKIINQDGSEAGDSGWQENVVVNDGFSGYLVTPLLGGSAKAVGRMCLGTGTNPDVTAASLPAEIQHVTSRNRVAVTTANVASKTARFTATWASSDSHLTGGVTIQNIGLVNNTTSGGTILCGKTYATSAWGTNQDVQATYDVSFAALAPLFTIGYMIAKVLGLLSFSGLA